MSKEFECVNCGDFTKVRHWEVGRECKWGDGFLVPVDKHLIEDKEKEYNKVWKETLENGTKNERK